MNEKSIPTPQQNTTATTTTTSPESLDQLKHTERQIEPVFTSDLKNSQKRQRLHNHKLRLSQKIQNEKHQQNQLASPPQDQVSSTQDQDGPSHNDHDCQTSPMMLVTTQTDDIETKIDEIQRDKLDEDSPISKLEDRSESPVQTQSSPLNNHASTTTTSTTPMIASTTTFITSPTQIEAVDKDRISSNNISRDKNDSHSSKNKGEAADRKPLYMSSKRRKLLNSSDHDASSITSWSSSYNSPPSPMSDSSSTSSISSSSSRDSSTSSCSSSSSLTPSLSPSPSPSPEIVNELRQPRLKLSEEKISKIKNRPIQFDDGFYNEHSFASTPTTSSGCSPGQHSNTTQNSDQSRFSIPLSNNVTHMFQAPPKFVNNLKPCNLPTKPKEPAPAITPPAPTKEMLNCAICGIKEPNISKIYGQNSCFICTEFFTTFLKRPQRLYCAQDGDCLMTFDSRCQACWIKICLQKFNIEDEHRKTGLKYSPKLLSCPNVSLITIDTSPR